MNVEISPSKLCGNVKICESKSELHRFLIAQSLCGNQIAEDKSWSADVLATANCLKNLNCVENIKKYAENCKENSEEITLNCGESGSTLRFLIPLACIFPQKFRFVGGGRLPQRPIEELLLQLTKNGANISKSEDCIVKTNGGLKSGKFLLQGDVTSQYVSGLLMALPLLDGDSEIKIVEKLQSKPYVNITIEILKHFGIKIDRSHSGYFVAGNQKYTKPQSFSVGGDWSNSAFWLSANFLGADINILGLDENSKQGDKQIVDFLQILSKQEMATIDVSDTPDLLPILATVSCMREFDTTFVGIERLKIKESDRIFSVCDCLKKMGAKVENTSNQLIVFGGNKIVGNIVDGFSDHRIVMSMAILGAFAEGKTTICGAEAVAKSYPNFFEDFVSLGGITKNV